MIINFQISLEPEAARLLNTVASLIAKGLTDQTGAFAALQTKLTALDQKIDRVIASEEIIIMNEQQMTDALNKIDQATTKAGTNLQSMGDTTQKISDEIDALKASMQQANVPQALVDQAQALGDRLQTVSDSLDQHATFLTDIAARGATDPVPTPVPPAPTV